MIDNSSVDPLSEFTRVPATPEALKNQQVPKGMMFTAIVTQEILDECTRALGRPLWDYEAKLLDVMLLAQGRANIELNRRGKPERTHSADEIVNLFVNEVKLLQMKRRLGEIAGGCLDG